MVSVFRSLKVASLFLRSLKYTISMVAKFNRCFDGCLLYGGCPLLGGSANTFCCLLKHICVCDFDIYTSWIPGKYS